MKLNADAGGPELVDVGFSVQVGLSSLSKRWAKSSLFENSSEIDDSAKVTRCPSLPRNEGPGERKDERVGEGKGRYSVNITKGLKHCKV